MNSPSLLSRPLAVRATAAGAWTLLALGFAGAVLELAAHASLDGSFLALLTLTFAMPALLVLALWRGQAWARLAWLLLMAALLYLYGSAVLESWRASVTAAVFASTLTAAAVLSVPALFLGAGGAWFRAAGAGPAHWVRATLLAVTYLVAAWFAQVMAIYVYEPRVALIAQTTQAYPLAPDMLTSAFLRYGPYDPNAQGNWGQPMLDAASVSFGFEGADRARSLEAVRLLVAKGAEVNAVTQGHTALHSAIITLPEDGDPAMVRMLLAAGADPSIPYQSPGSRWDGLDALGLAREMARRNPRKMARVLALLSGGTS